MFGFRLRVHDFVRVQVHARGLLVIDLVCHCVAIEEDVVLGTCLLKLLILIVFEFPEASKEIFVSLTALLPIKVDGRSEVDVLVLVGRVGFSNGLAILQSINRELEIVKNLIDVLHFV